MTKPYSDDLRERVVAAMQGGESCRSVELMRWMPSPDGIHRISSAGGSSSVQSEPMGSQFERLGIIATALVRFPNAGGRSRHGASVRTIHSTASRKSRASAPGRPAFNESRLWRLLRRLALD
jgi:hypothetical protein